MVTAVKIQTGNNIPSVLAGERISSDRSSISSTIAILSKQLPLPTAQQWAGLTVSAKMIGQNSDGQIQVEIDGQTITVALPANIKLPKIGQSILLTLALDPEIAQQPISSNGALTPKQLSGLGGIDTPPAQSLSKTNESTVDNLSSTGKLIGAIESLRKSQNIDITVCLPLSVFDHQENNAIHSISDEKPHSFLAFVSLEKAPESQLTGHTVEHDDSATPTTKTTTNISSNNSATQTTEASTNTVMVGGAKQNGVTEQIAKNFSDAIEHSGLFYESHLQQWVEGGRSVESLFKEPQATWDTSQAISETTQSNTDGLPASAKLVSSQLQLLDQPKLNLSFLGILGEPIDLTIEPQYDRSPLIDSPEQIWAARLQLDMPHLGLIDASVRLIGSTLDIQLIAPEASLPTIDQSWKDIESSLGNIGISLRHGQTTSKKHNP